jgi:hypothetical protein
MAALHWLSRPTGENYGQANARYRPEFQRVAPENDPGFVDNYSPFFYDSRFTPDILLSNACVSFALSLTQIV